ncbi:RagB/SusD family nutrient uptake outer membrane protein [Carboxylicivirga marina]|uniref:RagB/SusD family nutrient uptake outer membrane protein n=1 Tax=Carboxylicivirga marina TaxID=2800988 RepID=A0ABS1HFT5_9BACT|nr:RagB/SusD family nutrient uptake outer membrane protein [Carboxylicivirga marina]MBK3516163.1 RagB/SusD family nutrient uptake outer membrane protein [Carboxylicivirga marina]
MKHIKYFKFALLAMVIGFFATSCEDIGPGALEKPDGQDVTIDTIFSSTEYAERVLFSSYRSLRSGILKNGRSHAIGQDLQEDITDLSHTFKSWGTAMTTYYAGGLNSANSHVTSSHPDAWLAPMCILPYGDVPNKGITTFKAIRNCHILLDHVHKVPDMSEGYREQLKAEARVIIAYNMTELFRNYGGVPMIGKVYSPDDDFTNPRMTVEATVDSIVDILDKAIPNLPWQFSEADMSNLSGRFSQAGAMALKTRLLLFAASPLFNSPEPYMAGTSREEELLWWYGNEDDSRWQRAADAAKALIDKIEIEGGYALEMPETNDVWGYRDAFRRGYYFQGNFSISPSRRSTEVLISIRDGYESAKRWGGSMYDSNLNYGGATCTDEYMRMFPMADGTPITDPASGWNESVDPLGSEGSGAARQFNRDPRLYETMQCLGDDWAGAQVQTWKNNQGGWAYHVRGPRRSNGSGSTVIRKFMPSFEFGAYPVKDHHFPYIRLPEIYLSYAEAMAKLGNMGEAYTYINKVRSRVGLKNIEDVKAWGPDELVQQILTERACEFGYEQVRWFDMTRHKLESAFTQNLHNVWIEKNADGTFTYTYPEIKVNSRLWWNFFDAKWYLLPFPLNEIQKGYGLIQNPGW